MTVEYRALRPGEIDHEILWSGVLVSSAAMGWWWLQTWGAPPLVCPFKAATGFPCLTCGATRALLALAQGNAVAAIRQNPLVPFGALAASSYVLYSTIALVSGRGRVRARVSAREVLAFRWGAVAVSALVWGWLLIDGR